MLDRSKKLLITIVRIPIVLNFWARQVGRTIPESNISRDTKSVDLDFEIINTCFACVVVRQMNYVRSRQAKINLERNAPWNLLKYLQFDCEDNAPLGLNLSATRSKHNSSTTIWIFTTLACLRIRTQTVVQPLPTDRILSSFEISSPTTRYSI